MKVGGHPADVLDGQCDEPGPEFTPEGVRVSGWVHVGFGDDHTLTGGTIRAKMHNDALLSDCTLLADAIVVAEGGEMVVGDLQSRAGP